MKLGIHHYTLILLLMLSASSIGLWTLLQYQQHQQQQADAYVQQLQSWQAQIKTSQSEQLLWLQSRFYDMRSGLQQRLDGTDREQYLKQYTQNVSDLKLAMLYANAPAQQTEESSDCIRLAKTLFADLDKGTPPLFFSCSHQQQPMMGVKGDFRIYGHSMGLVLLMDYFGFLPEFSRLAGKQLLQQQAEDSTAVVFSDSVISTPSLVHEITFNRDEIGLGTLRLAVDSTSFWVAWWQDTRWIIPVVLVFTLLFYRLFYIALIRPLFRLTGWLQVANAEHRPGDYKKDQTLAPGLQLLQRYFLKLRHMAKNDPLTGLHNRVIFEDRVRQALLEGRRSGRKYALVFIDIFHFHSINKSYGHYVGDGLLKQLAERLANGLRESDSSARLEGDDFALLLEFSEDDQLNVLLDKIHQTLSQPYNVYGRSIKVRISVGVALYPQQAQQLDQLALKADQARLKAHHNQGGVVLIEEGDETDYSRFSHMQSFRQALENDEFKLVYQPVVDLKEHKVHYFEALLRWKKTDVEQLSIPQTIQLAENNKVIRPLTRWIINTACRQIHNLDNDHIKVAINLSMIDLHDDALPGQVAEALARFSVPAHQLMIEITEGQIIQDQGQVIGILNQLSAMGISLSIDDFGTGQASLTYLRKLPVEKLKIDQSFVRDMVMNKDDSTIVEATIKLAQTLGVEVVAEGVESLEIHDVLQQMGCNYAQGYYISKPMDAEQIPQWWEKQPA